MKKLKPVDLENNEDFQLLAELSHKEIKKFVIEQVMTNSKLVRNYGIYQISMMLVLAFLLVKAIIQYTRAFSEPIIAVGAAVLFSVTLLVILHELIHALAYLSIGARKIRAGAIWRKFIFYIAADRQVVNFQSFRIVALAPFVVVKIACIALTFLFWSSPLAYFFLSVMCIHSLFCGGDFAMLAFYLIHRDKEIYNFDDLKTGKTFFYVRKEKN